MHASGFEFDRADETSMLPFFTDLMGFLSWTAETPFPMSSFAKGPLVSAAKCTHFLIDDAIGASSVGLEAVADFLGPAPSTQFRGGDAADTPRTPVDLGHSWCCFGFDGEAECYFRDILVSK